METKVPGMDMEKFGEVMRETSVVKMDISLERLKEVKNKSIAMDERYADVDLSRFIEKF